MQVLDYFYKCSKEYIQQIHHDLYGELVEVISKLPKRSTQAEINKDLFWFLSDKGWSHHSTPPALPDSPPQELGITGLTKEQISRSNDPSLSKTSTTIDARWRADFAKKFGGKLVQVEVQFGKVELMFKDFCGFRIAYHEKRLSLGIEMVLCEPYEYFAHRKGSVSGMAYFDIAKNTMPTIGLDCPIWLVGIKE